MRSALAALLVVSLLPLAGCFGGDKEPVVPSPPCDPCEEPCEGVDALCAAPEPEPMAPATPAWPHYPSDGAVEYSTLELASFDEHQIPISIYKPKVASPDQKVPILLHSHGFTGKRATTEDAFTTLVAAGFGVVSFDERGHGDSKDDSSVYFMHPDYEVQDVKKIIDHVATFDWVLMEAPGDPLLGSIGGSYGGAFQLMGAIFDPRFDAIVPEITWNDITVALAPNGAVKSGWVNLFYVAGNAQQSVVFGEDFHVGFAYAMASNNFPAGQLPGVPDLYGRFKESSPVSYPGRLTIPTLLIQGMPDTLFPLNQAVANLRMLEANGLPANQTALYTHLGGHLLSVNSLRANTSPVPVGLQGVPGGKPCGELVDLQIAWHQKHLLGLPVDTGPRVCLSLEDETNVIGPTFPLPGTETRVFDLAGPIPVVQAPAGSQYPVSLFTAEADTIVAGIPHLKGKITAPGADTIVYFSLKILSRVDPFESIVDDQVVPLRVTGPNTGAIDFDLDMGGVGVRLKAGEELVLVVSTVEPMYFGNAERIPGGTVLDNLALTLPIVPNDTPSLVLPTLA
ncbi:MAG: alpha/beta hydrolase family protein [Thermoplasmatota archaeon]